LSTTPLRAPRCPRHATDPHRPPQVSVVSTPVFGDDRGYFTELFHPGKFAAMGLSMGLVQDNDRTTGGRPGMPYADCTSNWRRTRRRN
jgi:hypothetical protein